MMGIFSKDTTSGCFKYDLHVLGHLPNCEIRGYSVVNQLVVKDRIAVLIGDIPNVSQPVSVMKPEMPFCHSGVGHGQAASCIFAHLSTG